MAREEQVTVSVKYFLALQEVRRCAEFVAMTNEGTDEYVGFLDDLEAALGAILALEEDAPGSQSSP